MKVLITGASGFVGSHLAEYYLKKKAKVICTRRHHSCGDDLRNIYHIADKMIVESGDLMNYGFVYQLIEKHKPDIIHHLAAMSFVRESFDSPIDTMLNNIVPQMNILEAVRQTNRIKKTIIHIAGSSEEYGFVEDYECPITELNDLRPLSPYGVSKITQDFMAQQYHNSWGYKTVITRAFNHEGPRRGRDFVTSNFAEQIVRMELGLQDKVIHVGNLAAERDFTDIRDMVRAYSLAVKKCEYGEPYNIGTGEARSILNVLDTLIKFAKVDNIEIKQDEKRMRPSDVQILQANYNKFKDATGWKPEWEFEDIMESLLNYWRQEYGKSKRTNQKAK